MKKILLATSALVVTAGVASAEVGLSGWAEMGIVGGDGYVGDNVQFFSDLDIDFTLSGETDNGLTFGASIDLDEAGGLGAGTGNTFTNTAVFLSGSFGTLTMGDTDGAMDWAMQEVGIGSSIADDHTTHAGYNGNSRTDGHYGGQILRYNNSFGDLGVALSAQLDDVGTGDATIGVGVKYNAALGGADLGIGLGYTSYDGDDAWGISLDAKLDGGFRAILNYSDLGDSDGGGVGETHTAIGLGYSMDALTVSANYGIYDEGVSEQDGFGFAVNYDLGGAAVQLGYGDNSSCGVYTGCTLTSTWSLGLAMSF